MSMVLRRLGRPAESIPLAKEAVALDLDSPESWYVLGNAYLIAFATQTGARSDADDALKAYAAAEDADGTSSNPDLLCNRATAQQYMEDYAPAVDGYRRAAELDPEGMAHAAGQARAIVGTLQHVQEMFDARGKMKAKRLAAMVGTMRKGRDRDPARDVAKYVPLGELVDGETAAGRYCRAAIVSVLSPSGAVPTLVLVADEDETFFVVTLYNIAKDALSMADVLSIMQPRRADVDVVVDGHRFAYPRVVVDSPAGLLVNHGRDDERVFAMAQL